MRKKRKGFSDGVDSEPKMRQDDNVTDTVDPAVGRYQLSDRYMLDSGRVFLSGVQAAARLPLEQLKADRRRGLATAAFLSGYPGSPLAGFDREAEAVVKVCGELPIVHRPGLNEELAATAVMGSQLAAERPDSRYDGVVGFWYGKTPGVDRASDAIRHAVFAGVHRNGGVVALVGDDAAAKSSTLPSSSDATLIGLHMPILTPGDVQETLDLGRHAIALSRASGLWAGLKMVAPVADGTGTIHLDLDRISPILPQLEFGGRVFVPHADGNLITPHSLELEQEIFDVRREVAREYGRLNELNTVPVNPKDAWIGLAACGHTYHELRQALHTLGLRTDAEIAAVGIRLLRVLMPSPMDPGIIRRFGAGLTEILVVEDKNPTLESLIKDALWDTRDRPLITGKTDPSGQRLLNAHGSLDADTIVGPLRSRLAQRLGDDRIAPPSAMPKGRALIPLSVNRTPYFCSGCPHNISTQVPDGALFGGGIGCSTMAAFMDPERVGEMVGLTCMGNEGAQWVGMEPFVETPHLFQNIGDGTYAHSGQLAVQFAVAAGANMTYKILVNGVVAMTGGQAAQGAVDVPTMVRILLLQGVQQVLITTDDPHAYDSISLPSSVDVWDRTRMIEAQELLAEVKGVTVLIHDQACAAEKRRLRKRDKIKTPVQRVMINERVCEGCGDCGEKSNCLSVQPIETAFGRKTHIDQTSCNLDYSCITGDCPSFITITPSKHHKHAKPRKIPQPSTCPTPVSVVPTDEFTLRLPGIGGTGVVTVSQIIGTAGMLDGFHVRGLDQTGLSQKAGPVVSDVLLSHHELAGSNKAASGEVDVMLAFDLLGAASDAQIKGASAKRTVVIASSSATPTGSMVLQPGLHYPAQNDLQARLDSCSRASLNRYVPASELVSGLFGDTTMANIFMVGVAHQAGALPISTRSLERAIELNGVAVERNLTAFRWGRQWIVDPGSVFAAADIQRPTPSPGVIDPVAALAEDLVAYQSKAYSQRYLAVVDEVRASGASDDLVNTVARNLHKLMAYKDEYEVARLLLAPEAKVAAEAIGGQGAQVQWNLHPPLLRALGMQKKLQLGRWATPLLVGLRAARRLRGTPLDLPGYTKLRRAERGLVREYVDNVTRMVRTGADPQRIQLVAALPEMIRGYESIKERNIVAYHDRLAELLATKSVVS